MRPLRYDIAGTTDANGNLTIGVPLAGSGEHRIVKITASTPNGAEWAVLLSGSPVTFGRGRRVTLGPELLEPQDSLKLQVSGSLPGAAVVGTVSGLEGDFEEVIRQFSPQPNTIALDVNAPPVLLVEAPTGLNSLAAPLTKALPVGAVAVGYVPVVNPGGSINNVTAISIVGSQTGIVYVLDNANFPTIPIAVLLDPSDTSVVCNVQAAGARPAVDFLCWTVPTAVEVYNRTQTPLFVQQPVGGIIQVSEQFAVPAPWQIPRQSLEIHSSPPATTAWAALIAGVGGQIIYLFDWELVAPSAANSVYLSTANTSGGVGTNLGIFAELRMDGAAAPGPERTKRFGGFPVGGGFGIQGATVFWACDNSPNTVFGSLTYSQA